MKRAALFELVAGAALFAAGSVVLAGVSSARATPPHAGDADADPRPPAAVDEPRGDRRAPSLGRSPRDGEPPLEVGPVYDDDRAVLPRAAAVASYTLAAKLDAAAHRVDGTGTITWRNASRLPTSELYFHLYLNAFKNNKSLFLRSPFGGGRSGQGAKEWGYVDLRRLSVREMSGADVRPLPSSRGGSDPDDETDLRVPLPRAVEPGETITLDVAWTSQLPEIVERTGYKGDFHMVAQWFPKLARREPEGTWVHFPFHPQSEFYADFGAYDVTLDVPARFVVGATGVLAGERAGAGRRVLRYRADDVHDFAFTAWPGFLEKTATVDGVAVRVLYPRGNERNAEAELRAVRHGLAFFGKAYGRYPYPTLTVVHPPADAPNAGGMEYPTLITTGGPWYASHLSTFVERITLHEFAHQWFYGLVATDEHSFPFLDEGLTTYAEAEAMRALHGEGDGFEGFGVRVSGNAYARSLAAAAAGDDVVARPAADFVGFQNLGALVYARTGTILETLARVYGRESLARAVGRYARRYRFEHPGPRHFVAVVREVMGDDAADALTAALFEGASIDYVAGRLQSAPPRTAAGVFDEDGRRRTSAATDDEDRTLGRVVVYRHGALRLPVDVEITFEDGSSKRSRVDGRERFQVVAFEGRATSAVVDPDLALLLDENLANNAIAARRGSVPRLAERSLYAGELLLGVLGP